MFIHPFEKQYGPRPSPDETHYTRAADGWRLAMYRYRPRGEHAHGEPVLLQHGLGASAKQFDLGVGTPDSPTPSLARWLADCGYDVWACDLRGAGGSLRPDEAAPMRWNFSVDDFLHLDGPAFIDAILAATGFANLHWVGHSMGGILLLAHCAQHGSPRIASGIAAASGLDYSGASSSYDYIEPLKGIGRMIGRIPLGMWSKHVSPIFGRVANPIEASFYYLPNLSPAAARAIPAGVHGDVSGEVLFQLASLFRSGGLRSADGATAYLEQAANITTPICFLAGERDRQCAPATLARTHALLPGKKAFRIFGRSHGHAEHYGHFDLFAGLRADQEVFPAVLDWLKAHRAIRNAKAA